MLYFHALLVVAVHGGRARSSACHVLVERLYSARQIQPEIFSTRSLQLKLRTGSGGGGSGGADAEGPTTVAAMMVFLAARSIGGRTVGSAAHQALAIVWQIWSAIRIAVGYPRTASVEGAA